MFPIKQVQFALYSIFLKVIRPKLFSMNQCPAYLPNFTVLNQILMKASYFTLFLTLILFLTNGLYGQQYELSARLVDSETSNPVPFATVALYEVNNQTPLQGTTTDLEGNFSISIETQSELYIVISFIGFNTKELPLSPLGNQNRYDLGIIQLEPLSINLQEVEVSAMARTASKRLDRTSYMAKDFETARGGTAADLLSRLPALSVSPDGEVSVRGTTDFVVYLNGRPTQIDPDMLLSQIPANSIEGVDVITVPSAAYDAQGKGGIINITTRKEAQSGLSLSLNGMLGGSPWGNTTDPIAGDALNDKRYGAGFNLIYARNGWLLFGGFNYDYRNLHGQRGGTARLLDEVSGAYKIMDAEGLKPEWHENYSANLGMEKQLTRKSHLAASYYFGSKLEGRKANYLYDIFMTDDLDNSQNSNIWNRSFTFNPNTGIRKGAFNTLSLDYTYKPNQSSRWLFAALYEYTLLSHDIDNPNQAYDQGSSSLLNMVAHYKQNDETPLNGYRLSIDYAKDFANGLTFSTGIQPQYLYIAGNFKYDTLNVATNQWGGYTSLENASELRRGIYAAYVDLAGGWEQLQYKMGLRVEHTDQHLKIDNPDYFNLFERPVQDDYVVQQTDLFPSLHAAYAFANSDVLSLAASRRISRAPVKNMFPFLYRRHLEVYVVGDPALKPEYIQTYELSYKKNVGNQQFNLTGFYRGVTNAVFRVNTVFSDEQVLISSFTNAGETVATGAELSTNLEWGNRAKFFISSSLYHFRVQAAIFGYSEDNRSTNWNLKGSGNYNISKAFRLSADFEVRSAEVTAQGSNALRYMANAALSYSPPKQQAWTFNLRALNIFDSNLRGVSTRAFNKEGVQIFYQDTDYYYFGPIAELSISYNLNFNGKQKPKDKTGFGKDEF
jgi:outer membrane receptor protein involved in Fe transport